MADDVGDRDRYVLPVCEAILVGDRHLHFVVVVRITVRRYLEVRHGRKLQLAGGRIEGEQAVVSTAIESGVTSAISLLVIRVSLYVTDQITDAMWGMLAAVLPFAIPERLVQLIDFFVDIGAEVFFVAALLGYAWARKRQQFMRL